jgi:hypothetical protein
MQLGERLRTKSCDTASPGMMATQMMDRLFSAWPAHRLKRPLPRPRRVPLLRRAPMRPRRRRPNQSLVLKCSTLTSASGWAWSHPRRTPWVAAERLGLHIRLFECEYGVGGCELIWNYKARRKRTRARPPQRRQTSIGMFGRRANFLAPSMLLRILWSVAGIRRVSSKHSGRFSSAASHPAGATVKTMPDASDVSSASPRQQSCS